MRQCGFLSVSDILQQGPGRSDACRERIAAETRQVPGAKLPAQQPCSAVLLEVPGRSARDANAVTEHAVEFLVLINDELGRAQPLDFALYRLEVRGLGEPEPPCGKIEPGDAKGITTREHGSHDIVALRGEQRFVSKCPGCDNARNLALDRPFACRRVTDLFANGNGLALAHELGEIAFDCVIGHTGHRDRVACRFATCRERNVQQRRCTLRIIIEKFVEIPHPVEHEHVRILGLDGEVLAHHRCVNGGDFGFHR